MRYGVYEFREDAPGVLTLLLTRVSENAARMEAVGYHERLGAKCLVVLLGPQTPDILNLADSFFPKVLYRTEGL